MTATACDVGRATAGEGNAPETLARRLRTHLQVVAKQRVPITYQEAVNAVRLTAPNTIHQVTDALEHLMAEDPASGRPFIAAIVISKARGGLPAPGFLPGRQDRPAASGCSLPFEPVLAHRLFNQRGQPGVI